MTFLHPYSKYGLALIMLRENLKSIEEVKSSHLEKYIEDGLSHFRMKSNNDPEIDDILEFHYLNRKEINDFRIKGNPLKGIYLCPNIIANDLKSGNAWSATESVLSKVRTATKLLDTSDKITMGIVPIAGEVNNGTKSKKNAKATLMEIACCAITNTTWIKPCFTHKKRGAKGQLHYIPTCIIPDLNLDAMMEFINLFSIILIKEGINKQSLQKKVYRSSGTKSKFSRPKIYDGNFPDPPKNSAFGILGLLGAIGKMVTEAQYLEQAETVLNSLKGRTLYLISYGTALSVTINHFVIDLAIENKLADITDSIQRTIIIHPFDEKIGKDTRAIESRKELFSLLGSRFLQSFNKASFNDFLSIRAEYESNLTVLFNLFFEKQMGIKREIVDSAMVLGLWLNKVAFIAAKTEADTQKRPDKIRDFKSKILIQLESTVFGSRTPSDILNVIPMAGRLTGLDAPNESNVFINAVLTGEVSFDNAKSILMAYSRIRSTKEQLNSSEDVPTSDNEEENEEFSDDEV